MAMDPWRVAELWNRFDLAREQLNASHATPDNPAVAEALLDELLATEEQLDFSDEADLPPSAVHAQQRVAVLLPLRIETRFEKRSINWILRLRLFPEPIAFDQRPRPLPGETRKAESEQRALTVFWTEAGTLDSAAAPKAFRILADAVGAARAAWLIRRVGVTTTATGPVVDVVQPPEPPLAVLPPRLTVWLARGGGELKSTTRLAVDATEIAEQSTIDRLTGTESKFDAFWWNNFAIAEAVGLACEIELGPVADVDLLVVTGVGEKSAAELFEAHASAGSLGIVPPGTATNTVDGAATIPTTLDADAWFALVRRIGYAQAGTRQVATCLTGNARSLPALPSGDVDVRTVPQRAAALLLPGIIGRALHDQWGLGIAGHAAQRWATRFLLPGGACPVVRVGDVPYGVLPVAAPPNRWQPSSDEPSTDAAILDHAARAAAIAAATAEIDDQLVNAGADRVLDQVTRSPVSPGWRARPGIPLPLVAVGMAAATSVSLPTPEQIFEDAARQAVDAALAPAVPIVSLGNAVPIDPKRVDRDALDRHELEELAFAPWTDGESDDRQVQDYNGELLLGISRREQVGRHLIEYLIDASLVLTHARLSDIASGNDGSIGLVDADELEQQLSYSARPEDRNNVFSSGPLGAEVARAWEDARHAFDAFMFNRYPMPELVDAALSLLDTASHRADPWATGVADRRLRRLAATGVPFVVGAYGWVDSPMPTGGTGDPRLGPGPTSGGLVHTPGAPHAVTAAMLRDCAINRPHGMWNIALDSARIRSAQRLAAYIRAGITLAEALGRECERILGSPERVTELRRTFPVKKETAGRQVCHGQEVMAAVVPAHPLHLALTTAPISATIAELAEIDSLKDAIDAYADLLVTDATFALVNGQGRIAAEALDSVAGLGPPSEMRALRTPRRGATVSTTVFGIVPSADPAADAGPSGIASPEIAAELVGRFGKAGEWRWERATATGSVVVTLADLGLDPIDVLTLDERSLTALLGRGAPLRSAGGAQRVAAARRLARAVTGTLAAPIELQPLADGRADDLTRRAHSDLELLAAFVGDDPSDDLLVIVARWGIAIVDADLDATPEGMNARGALVSGAHDELAARLSRDNDALPVDDRVRNLLGAHVPMPVSIGSLAELGLAGAQRHFDFDRQWLEPVAAVRKEAADIEAYQLTPGPGNAASLPLHVWTKGLAPWSVPTIGMDHTYIICGPAGTTAMPSIALWVRAAWSEVVPARAHTTHAAFGFNAPDSRAPQSVLTVVPPDLSRPLDDDDLAAAVAWTRTLSHARVVGPAHLRAPGIAAEVTPLTLLHAVGRLHVDPGGTGRNHSLPGNFMVYERLEPDILPDVEAALRVPVADPLWMIGRQWQFGEHRGEDSSSPVELQCDTSTVALRSIDQHFGRPNSPVFPSDPSSIPAEALIEADPASWWTLGRRIRLGELALQLLDTMNASESHRQPLRFPALPPPYTAHSGAIDGRAVYQAGLFAGEAIWQEVPTTPPDHWRTDRLDYAMDIGAGSGTVRIEGHDGGEVDWWSGDAINMPDPSEPLRRSIIPSRLRYPGAPLPRYWQIEDDGRDPAGFPPDAPRWATSLWTDAVSSTSGDWFTAPVPTSDTSIGSIVTLHAANVRDSFDEWWPLIFPPGLGEVPNSAADPLWSLFRTRGLSAGALVLWPTAVSPLSSSAWEEVLLGVDEDADLCWAVETRIDGLAYDPGVNGPPPANAAPEYMLAPSWGIPPHGHPYRIESGGAEGRRFVQGLVADLSGQVPRLRPGPRTSLLHNRSLRPGHELRPSAVPSVGVRLVRCWRLARDTNGKPVLWLQTERQPLIVGPVSHLRFDVFLPDSGESGG